MRSRTFDLQVTAGLLLAACSFPPATRILVDGPPAGLKASSVELFEQYGAALSAPRPEALSGFYHYGGALRVFNGVRRVLTRAELDSIYRGSWKPPEYFAWEQLTYDSIAPGLVIATGGFLWKARGGRDTTRYLYTALLQAVDSGMTIRFEEETLRPPPE